MEFTIKANVHKFKDAKNGAIAGVTFIISDMIWCSGFTLRQGNNGLWLSRPQYRGSDGKYVDITFGKKEVFQRLQEIAIAELEKIDSAPTTAKDEKLPF